MGFYLLTLSLVVLLDLVISSSTFLRILFLNAVCVCTICMSACAAGSQRHQIFLKLELQVVVSYINLDVQN